jgi:hypothetical protein
MNSKKDKDNKLAINSIQDERDQDDSSSNGSDLDDQDDVLPEITDEKKYFAEKLTFQRRALMRKNITLQWKQKWTNLW